MIQVNEILSNSLLTNYTIVAGESYLRNVITSVAVLEYESILNRCKGFRPGQFVIASYFLAESSGDIINLTLDYLIKQRVGAIAIKTRPGSSLPENLLQDAEAYKVPIITFNEGWVEDILININSLISHQTSVAYREHLLLSILYHPDTFQSEVESTIKKIWPESFDNMIIALISPIKDKRTFDTLMYVETLSLLLRQHSDTNSFRFFKLENSILFLQTLDSVSDIKNMNYFTMRLMQMLRYAKLNPDDFRIGIFDMPIPLSHLDLGIRKAKEINIICGILKQSLLLYSEEHDYKYIFNLLNDPVYYNNYKNAISLIEKYDSSNHSSLMKSLLLLAQNNNNYKTVANILFSHENTIRYRLKKAIELLHIPPQAAELEITLLMKSYILDHADLFY